MSNIDRCLKVWQSKLILTQNTRTKVSSWGWIITTKSLTLKMSKETFFRTLWTKFLRPSFLWSVRIYYDFALLIKYFLQNFFYIKFSLTIVLLYFNIFVYSKQSIADIANSGWNAICFLTRTAKKGCIKKLCILTPFLLVMVVLSFIWKQ